VGKEGVSTTVSGLVERGFMNGKRHCQETPSSQELGTKFKDIFYHTTEVTVMTAFLSPPSFLH
jgi:hypothetical protein